MKAQSHPADTLVFECDFEEPPEKVWRALTEPRLLEKWLATDDRSSADSTEGRPTRSASQRSQRVTRSSEYEVLTAEPHRLLRYRWRDRESGAGESGRREVLSVVTVELAPDVRGGTHLRLTHGEFRIISVPQPTTAGRVTPITSARRRRTPILSLAVQHSLRRAA